MQLPVTMHGVVYTSGIPPLDVCLKTDLKTPTPGASLVIVRVLAAALNPVDMKIKTIPVVGSFQQNKVVGYDLSGEVVYSPDGCGFQVGDAVFGFSKRIGEKHGSVAQFVEADPKFLTKKPPPLSHIEAAMIPLAGCTSLQALRDYGRVRAGDRVLVIGASGGTGLLGVQIGKMLGCHVTGICSAKNVPLVKSMGADEVHAYDSPQGSVPSTSPEHKFDCIYDTVTSPDAVDPNYEPLARPLLRTRADASVEVDASGLEVEAPRRDGVYVAINSKSQWDWAKTILAKVSGVDLQRSGYKLAVYDQRKADLEWLANAAASGKLKLRLDDTAAQERFGLEREEHARQAFAVLAGRRATGKVVFGMSSSVWEDT